MWEDESDGRMEEKKDQFDRIYTWTGPVDWTIFHVIGLQIGLKFTLPGPHAIDSHAAGTPSRVMGKSGYEYGSAHAESEEIDMKPLMVPDDRNLKCLFP